MTLQVVASVEVAVPPDLAFAALIDLPSQDRWIIATRLFALDGPVVVPEVGARLAALTGLGGIGFLDTMVVTAFEAGRKWEVLHTGRVVRGTGVFSVEPVGTAGTRCRVSWAEVVELPLGILGRVGWPLVRPVVRAGLQASLRRLAAGLLAGTLPVAAAAPTRDARRRGARHRGARHRGAMTDRIRCGWADSAPEYADYHDDEWGVPLHGDDPLFERLCLEAFQSGLSWITILRKRPAFRAAFAGFDIEVVAGFDEHDHERLMADAGIVRNRAKIEAAIANARVAAELPGGLDAAALVVRP